MELGRRSFRNIANLRLQHLSLRAPTGGAIGVADFSCHPKPRPITTLAGVHSSYMRKRGDLHEHSHSSLRMPPTTADVRLGTG